MIRSPIAHAPDPLGRRVARGAIARSGPRPEWRRASAAVFEAIAYDSEGQLLSGTFMPIRPEHMLHAVARDSLRDGNPQ
jgi:hypothetical protein